MCMRHASPNPHTRTHTHLSSYPPSIHEPDGSMERSALGALQHTITKHALILHLESLFSFLWITRCSLQYSTINQAYSLFDNKTKAFFKSRGVVDRNEEHWAPPGSFVCFREEHAYPYLYSKRTARTLVTQTNLCPNDQSTLTANLVWLIFSLTLLIIPLALFFVLLHAKWKPP